MHDVPQLSSLTKAMVILSMTTLTTLSMLEIGMAQDTAQETTDRFDSLLAAWSVAPPGSDVEQAVEDSIQTLVSRLVGPDAIDAFGRYLRADIDSEEEARAFEDARMAAYDGIRWTRAQQLLMAYWIIENGSGGNEDVITPRLSDNASLSVMRSPDTSSAPSQVDIVLESTQDIPTVGGRFAVLGTITNRTDRPVWIVDRYTTLLPPPEIWGRGPSGSMMAFFPSLPAVKEDEVVRIDALGSYVVFWHLAPRMSNDPEGGGISMG